MLFLLASKIAIKNSLLDVMLMVYRYYVCGGNCCLHNHSAHVMEAQIHPKCW
jgi:hypothetical protein